ncbi:MULTISPECIES: chemotaxis protein CheA [Gammaproteobacteria]|uniref:chemotaxis protein CheA n=1 Tax=Gammaproteobacteria TaxID=1236 RepID=UPI000DCFC37F|nr:MULTISPECIES: chemotaxis protein CheA [Gammaproteobacteria]RTE86125.1 chemotaxis protein CheA [Aliidiomarina sp. B3213]TCZ91478.1 chemotaxis protein CheA [Lysobacter sp. N42]
MSFDVDEDILQDFLIEAGEILELLSEQLVQLENDPDNRDLLNAIFRGFHTVKGGAGFLSLHALVDTCHGAENVFDTMRNGGRQLNPELMDVILQALDTINEQFAAVQAREEPVPASEELLQALTILSEPGDHMPGDGSASAEDATEETPTEEPEAEADESGKIDALSGEGGVDEITEDEFDALLDELHGGGKPAAKASEKKAPEKKEPAASGSGDEISDDEFEALLDELHGSKGAPKPAEKKEPPKKAEPKAKSGGGDDISDDEFEALLDELHGEGKFEADKQAAKPAAKSEAKPQEKPQAKPAAKPAASKPAEAPAAPAKKDAGKPTAPPAETTVRVDTRRLDEIMNMVGELVLVRNRLLLLNSSSEDEELNKAISNLDVVTGDLQGAVMQTRMQPIKKVFGRFPRVVRDLARSLKKEITLELYGEDTDLDKNLVEALADPLVHLVRNSVDHGIEMPDVREKVGKSRMGTVKLSASQEGDHILLSIDDDGAGMDAEKLKNIAIGKGILDADAAARMTDEEAYNLIFAAGFSTKAEISDISGRGVGMDVVKTKISQLNGSIRIDSELGRGTRLEIKVPLTLAILPTLMVRVGEQVFALPLAAVNEIINVDLELTNTVDGQLTMIVREKAIPMFYLSKWLNKKQDPNFDESEGHVVVVSLGTQQVGFVVDALIGQEEVVIKPLDRMLQGTPGMAGATITSDGGIALILDVPSLLKKYAKRYSRR